jgi:hypothetical protein
VPTTSTKMTANITAYSAMSCPASSTQNLSTVINHYVEKKTRGWTVPVAECPKAIGAGFAETGCFFAKAMSSRSILALLVWNEDARLGHSKILSQSSGACTVAHH